jgi:hypothetical protein
MVPLMVAVAEVKSELLYIGMRVDVIKSPIKALA